MRQVQHVQLQLQPFFRRTCSHPHRNSYSPLAILYNRLSKAHLLLSPCWICIWTLGYPIYLSSINEGRSHVTKSTTSMNIKLKIFVILLIFIFIYDMHLNLYIIRYSLALIIDFRSNMDSE